MVHKGGEREKLEGVGSKFRWSGGISDPFVSAHSESQRWCCAGRYRAFIEYTKYGTISGEVSAGDLCCRQVSNDPDFD